MKVGRSCPGTKLLSPGLEHKAIFHLLCMEGQPRARKSNRSERETNKAKSEENN